MFVAYLPPPPPLDPELAHILDLRNRSRTLRETSWVLAIVGVLFMFGGVFFDIVSGDTCCSSGGGVSAIYFFGAPGLGLLWLASVLLLASSLLDARADRLERSRSAMRCSVSRVAMPSP